MTGLRPTRWLWMDGEVTSMACFTTCFPDSGLPEQQTAAIAKKTEAASVWLPPPAMPLDQSRTTASPPTPGILLNLGLLLLRFVTGSCLLSAHGWGGGLAAWSHIWKKTPWGLPGQLADLGFPFALPLGIALILLTLVAGVFLILGLLTRSSALVIGLMTLTAALLYRAFPGVAETAMLYTGICVAIFLGGPGAFSLDHWLRAATRRRKA